MKLILIFLLSFLISNCKSTSNPVDIDINLGEEFNLNYGQTANFKDKSLSIKFKSIEDSRCPIGAVCVWEGNARIIIGVNEVDFSLNSKIEPKEIQSLGYLIKLISVYPYPNIDNPIKLKDYTITLIVTEGVSSF